MSLFSKLAYALKIDEGTSCNETGSIHPYTLYVEKTEKLLAANLTTYLYDYTIKRGSYAEQCYTVPLVRPPR